MPVETSNRMIREGKLPQFIQSVLAEARPGAAYFVEDQGKRTAMLFLGIQDPSQIPSFAEPWFLAWSASVEFHPAMNAEDLAKADLAGAVKKWGS